MSDYPDAVTLPDSAHTAPEAAAAIGVEVGAIVKSLVFLRGDVPVLVLCSGANMVDADALGLTRANAKVVREATGQPIGGVAPVGHPAPLRTLVDVLLAEHDVVWAAGGVPHVVFATTYEELLRITAGTPAEVG